MRFRVPQAINLAFINRTTVNRLHPVEQAALKPEADEVFCPGGRNDVTAQRLVEYEFD
jgi:hypothetical protein